MPRVGRAAVNRPSVAAHAGPHGWGGEGQPQGVRGRGASARPVEVNCPLLTRQCKSMEEMSSSEVPEIRSGPAEQTWLCSPTGEHND